MSREVSETVTAIILLPKFYNPDKKGARNKVEEIKFTITCREITRIMIKRWGEGGCTLDLEPKKGLWRQHRSIRSQSYQKRRLKYK